MARQWRRAAATAVLGIAATAMWTPSAIAEENVLPGAGAQTVEGSYIVVLKDGARTPASALVDQYRGRIRHIFSTALHGFSVEGMTEQQARRLAADPAVDFVERNTIARIQDTQNDPTWGLDRIDQANLPLDRRYTYPNTASNVTAYVLDSGIRKTHAEFENRAVDGYDFIDNDSVAQDCNGHGTHVAGTVAGKTYGVAKKAKVVGVRVLDCGGSGPWDGIIRAIDWVTQNAAKPAVVNMSLGGSGSNSSLENAVRRSIGAGITYVLAGGNDGQDACNFTPARTPEAITVGASDQSDKRSIWTSTRSSNHGSCLDIWAPGTAIRSASHQSDSGTTDMGGTSMASPHVAGAAALYLSVNPSATPAQVREALVKAATPNKLTDIKTGSPNLLLNIGNSGGGDPNPPDPSKLTVAANPASVTVSSGQQAVTTIAVKGGSGTVQLSASGAPQGTFTFFQPSTLSADGTSRLSLFTGWAPRGTYSITVTATDGATTATTVLTLTIR